MTDSVRHGPLVGVRVLDLADETAVLGTKLLSDLGADVLRIEPPEGDPIRRLGPFADDIVDPERSLSHWWFNSGKRSAILDLGLDEGRGRLAELAGQADIVIESGGTGVDFTAIRESRPALTVVSVSALGQSGPRQDWLAPDLVIWALGGGMSTTGLPDRYPLHANWLLASQVAGIYAAIGALAGLYRSRATGQGLHFDLSCLEALAATVENLVILYLYNEGRIQARMGVEHPSAVPWGAFPTQDGQVIFIPLTQGQWTTLLAWMAELGEVEPWALDEALVPLAARVPLREHINEWLGRWTQQFTSADLAREANQRRLPCAPINAPLDVLRDEQLRARGFFVPVDQPVLGRAIDYPGLPYQFPDGGSIRPAPRLGAHQPAFDGGIGDQGAGIGAERLGSKGKSDPAQPSLLGADREVGTGSRQGTDTPIPDPRSLTPAPRFPLDGLKVLDLTWAVAGPQGTKVLADLGAEVIKIEPREVGDLLRGIPPHWKGQPDPNQAGHFHRLNRNKRNLTLDLKKPAGEAVVKRLAAWADVTVDNFGAGVMARFGFGPEDLTAVNPMLIQVSLSGYGQSGPHRNYPSYALISAARGGLVYSTAYPDGTVAGPGIAIGDTGAGLQLALAVLAAVEQRRRTGRGTVVDMSQLEAATIFIGPALLDAAVKGRSFVPRGNLLPDRLAAPHGVYPAQGDDRWVAIAALSDDHWRKLAGVMDFPELAIDARFARVEDRVTHCEALDALITAWTRHQDAHHLAERLQAAGVPTGVVQNAPDLLADPHLADRGFYQPVDQPEIGPVPMDTMPLRWTDGPVPIRAPAPLIGEHNEYVLREVLGLSEEEIVELIVNEVI